MKNSITKRFLSVFLCIALMVTYFPLSATAVSASDDRISRLSDPSTMDSWRDFFLPDGKISTENAGGVWMDKSVFTDNSEFADTGITMDNSNAFLVALSAMATNMTVTGMSHVPTDTMLVLDVSGSMGSGDNDVAEDLVEAANTSIFSLFSTNSLSRVGVVLYSGPTTQGGAASADDAVLLLPLGRYKTGADGKYLVYTESVSPNGRNTTETVSIDTDVVYEGSTTKPSSSRKNVVGGTYIQKGIMLAANQLSADGLDTTVNDSVLGTVNRKPVMILMSDGSPTFSSTNFQNPSSINLGDGTATSAAQGFVNQLTAAYAKNMVKEKYGADPLFYTIGLGVSNDAIALSVLDPDNSRASVAVNDFWAQWNNASVGDEVTVQSDAVSNRKRSVTKIAGLEQNYVDEFINVTGNSSGQNSLGDRLIQAFADIVSKINLQAQYKPTLISQMGENHSGFISFVDKIGEYMFVSDIKGIIINDTLYSGADLSSNFVAGGGKLGTFDNPTALGHEMVAAVRQRIGLSSDDEARTLIGLAYEYGQIRYNNADDYSNYIGWYADENSNFLGFYQDGVTNITDPDAVYTIRSYGYLGVEHDSNMMYATVQVRHNIKTGEETVALAVPAALIPVMTYNVSLDSDGELTDIELTGSDSPIRLVYEVALDSNINEWNVNEVVSADYLADEHNVNEDGSVNFYTNDWEHTNSTGYNAVNTYSYFNPSKQNSKYYYTSDAPIYTDEAGTLYTGSSAPDINGIYYRAYTVYEQSGTVREKRTVYRQLSSAALETAKRADDTSSWYISDGNVHVNLSGYTVSKGVNTTHTLETANQPFVDVYGHNVNDKDHLFYVGATLGNNGKLILDLQTGIKLSKTMAEGTAATDEAFEFVITKSVAAASTHRALLVESDGTENNVTVSFDGSGIATVELKAGQLLYIGDFTAADVISISEAETVDYVPLVFVNGAEASVPAAVTVENKEFVDVDFVNSARGKGNLTVAKEVSHDLGANYQVPADKLFTVQVTLSGIGTADSTFEAKHTNGAYTEIKTDENGQLTVQLAHGQQFEIFGLLAGTSATVTETEYGEGFEPVYWNDGVRSDEDFGEVTVENNSISSVVIENDYTAARVYPVSITVSGNKSLSGTDWQESYSFDFKLEKLMADGSWQQLGDIETASYGNTVFSFDDAFQDESYTEVGSYYYRITELQPEEALGGITYDKTVHSFTVYVGDEDMDGQLEITEVASARPDTTVITKTDDGWNVNAAFTNVYSVSGAATVTIDINKVIENNGGSEKSLANYNFGLFNASTGEQVGSTLATTERGFARFVLTYDAAEMNSDEETFRYILKEIIPATVPEGWTYSNEEIPITVVVKDDGDGTISAVIYKGDVRPDDAEAAVSATFTNIYSPDSAALEIDFVSKKLSGREMSADDNFTFEVQSQDGTPVLSGSNNGSEEVTFNGSLSFDKVGTYTYNIVETAEDGNGITADKNVYRIVVSVTDENGKLKADYSVVNVVGNEIVFTNTYRAEDVSYAISGTKNLVGRVLINDEFTFVLTEAVNAQGEIAEGAETYEAHNEYHGRFTFPEITYDEVGTYYYVVSEKQDSGSSYGIRYDNNNFVVTVTVSDDTRNGKLVASADLGEDEIVFNNRYVAESVAGHIDGEKILNGKTLVYGQFEFELRESDSEWNRLNSEPIQVVKNDSEGNFEFVLTDYENGNATEFTEAGTYYYLISELNGGNTIKGITYDGITYRVRVDVTDDLLGQLHATVHIYDGEGVPQEAVIFRNSYEITGDDELTLTGTKKLNKAIPENRIFEFELYKANSEYEIDGDSIQKVTQDENGKFEFTVTYKPEDISDTPYYYVVKEVNGGERINGVTYDDTQYRVEVKVEDDDEGGVSSSAVIRKDKSVVTSIDFENTYKADAVGIVFEGKKELKGNRNIKADDYTFEIFYADETFNTVSSAAPPAKNDVDHKFSFSEIFLDTAKTYYFVARENSENILGGVTYDSSEYHITVKVTDNGNGELEIEDVTYIRVKGESSEKAEMLLFENSYKAGNATVSIGGTKVLKNRTLGENEFRFFLSPADENYKVDEAAVASEAKNKADGAFTFPAITFEKAGSYYFVVSEDLTTTAERVTNDTSVYYVAIVIEDDGNGKLYEADRKITKSGSDGELEDIVFNNVFIPEPEDITVDIGVVKTVINKGNEKIGPDGFEFVLENTDTNEKWSVKSDTRGNAVFTLGYTEADVGKTYTYRLTEVNGGKANITYSTKEYTVTVKISLNEDNELTALFTKNGEEAVAVVAEFENIYDYTIASKTEYTDSPETGDATNLHLWFALLFVSGGGIFSTAICGRKKKEEKQSA